MGMLRCIVIVATFAVLTKAGQIPVPQVNTNTRIVNSPTIDPQEQNPVNPAGQGFPGNQQEPGQGFTGNQQQPGQGFTENQQQPGQGFTGNQQQPGQGFTGNQQQPGQGFTGNQQQPGQGFTGNQQQPGQGFTGNQQQPGPTGSSIFPPTSGSQNPSPTHPPVPPTTSSIPTTTTTTTTTNEKEKDCGHFPSPGECQAAFPRYWYNKTSSQCDCYLYGGCDEDRGSYKTLEECHSRCLPTLAEEGPSCRFVYIDDFSISSPSSTTSTPFTETPATSNKPTINEQPVSFPSNGNPSSDSPLIAASGTPAGSETKPVNLNPPVDGHDYVLPVDPEPEYDSYPEPERENDSHYYDEDDSHSTDEDDSHSADEYDSLYHYAWAYY